MREEHPETQIDAAWAELRNLLEQERVRVQEEIASYPPPITACDAQFNHLLEQRTRVARELTRMANLAQTPSSEAERRELDARVEAHGYEPEDVADIDPELARLLLQELG